MKFNKGKHKVLDSGKNLSHKDKINAGMSLSEKKAIFEAERNQNCSPIFVNPVGIESIK